MSLKVVGIRFKRGGKKYYFDPLDYTLNEKDKVVVETIRGYEMGEVVEKCKEIPNEEVIGSLKPILRLATKEDITNHDRNMKEQAQIVEKCQKAIEKNGLQMKLLGCEYTLDRAKLVCYYNADGRVDFRELVKDLAAIFKVRIELRQVGTRDGAKYFGGIGPCGLLLCCKTFLGDFETVSIKMAKNQNLSLNPVNISGLCDKLLCCIKYEDDYYKESRKEMPKDNSQVFTKDGTGKVVSSNLLTKKVKVQLQSGEVKEYSNSEIKFSQKAIEDNYIENFNELKSLEE